MLMYYRKQLIFWMIKILTFLFIGTQNIKFFVKKRLSVKWGGQSLIIATLRVLLDLVRNNNKEYDYVHLISANDIPLMTKNYFKNFFVSETYIGFDKNFSKNEIKNRVVSFWDYMI